MERHVVIEGLLLTAVTGTPVRRGSAAVFETLKSAEIDDSADEPFLFVMALALRGTIALPTFCGGNFGIRDREQQRSSQKFHP